VSATTVSTKPAAAAAQLQLAARDVPECTRQERVYKVPVAICCILRVECEAFDTLLHRRQVSTSTGAGLNVCVQVFNNGMPPHETAVTT